MYYYASNERKDVGDFVGGFTHDAYTNDYFNSLLGCTVTAFKPAEFPSEKECVTIYSSEHNFDTHEPSLDYLYGVEPMFAVYKRDRCYLDKIEAMLLEGHLPS